MNCERKEDNIQESKGFLLAKYAPALVKNNSRLDIKDNFPVSVTTHVPSYTNRCMKVDWKQGLEIISRLDAGTYKESSIQRYKLKTAEPIIFKLQH